MLIELSPDELVVICEGLKLKNSEESNVVLTKLQNELISSMQSKELKEIK